MTTGSVVCDVNVGVLVSGFHSIRVQPGALICMTDNTTLMAVAYGSIKTPGVTVTHRKDIPRMYDVLIGHGRMLVHLDGEFNAPDAFQLYRHQARGDDIVLISLLDG